MNGPREHWLRRPETIRKLWFGGIALLAILVALDLFITPHPYFGLDGGFAFHAWYGFGTCVAMVLAAKLLGVFLKRKDDYYERD